MKLLLLDIETAPNLAYVWGLWKQNINPEFVAAAGYVLCWTAKWYHEPKLYFKRLHKGKPISLLEPIQRMLCEAEAVIHYNGTKFDIPTLQKEFLLHGIPPPSPYRQVDLLRTMREQFRFPSNKLDYISQTLDIGKKIRHAGPQLWLDCMADDALAWKKMERYNKHDVRLLERLYDKILPWVQGHPNHGAYDDIAACPKCGSMNFNQRGYQVTVLMKYRRYQCRSCGTWFRGTKSVNPKMKDRYAGIR